MSAPPFRIDPDQFLDLSGAVAVTREDVRAAWERAIGLARAAGCRCVGVWIDTPWAVAVQRNARRTGLARIREEAMRHVAEALQPPLLYEGFDEVVIVRAPGDQ